jgi:hypothetical protein
MNLDHELRQALRRPEAPPGFEQSVLSRIAGRDPGPALPVRYRRRWLALPVAASLVAAFGWGYHLQVQRRAAAERAAYEVSIGLQIAGEKLLAVQKKVENQLRYQYEQN